MEIIDTLVRQMLASSWLEIIAGMCGILSVYFSFKEHILVFPFGIVSVLIYVYICYGALLYADTAVNAYYFIMSIYGWYFWLKGGDNRSFAKITKLNAKGVSTSLALLFISFGLLAISLTTLTNSDVPFIDAASTSFAICGMYLMSKKKLEHWVAWIITDLISIPLYAYKGLVFTSFQYLIFTAFAFAGLLAWHKKYKAGILNINKPLGN